MLRSLRSVSIFFPALMTVGIFSMIIVGMINGYNNRLSQINMRSVEDIKGLVAQLSHLAESSMRSDTQLLYDDLTQRATDRRVKAAVTIDQDGKILFSTNFSWLNQDIKQYLPDVSQELIDNAASKSSAIIRQTENQILAAMSFNSPTQPGQIRASEKSLIIVLFDITHEKENLFLNVINERAVEVLIAVFALIASIWLMHKYITIPLQRLQMASQKISSGEFLNTPILPGPDEIKEMTQAFNIMSESLSSNIRELERTGQQTQTILDNIVDGILTINEKGLILTGNKAAERIFGYGNDALKGTHIGSLVADLSAEKISSSSLMTIDALINTKGSEVQLIGLRRNCEVFPLEIGLAEIKSSEGRFFVAIVRDISERKKIERMKSEFISTVSHELRTPLTVINGAISLIRSGVLGAIPEKMTDIVEAADRNGKRLLLLINDLLDMEKIVSGKLDLKLEPVSVETILDESIKINEIYGNEYNITLKKQCSVEDAYVNVDLHRLNQVISNLLSNAFKFSKEGGLVEIGAEKSEETLRIFVRDYGSGIPLEFHDRIFEKFTQADATTTRNKGGTGLGLAISRELVISMNGFIGFESEVEKGTTFYFDLPLITPGIIVQKASSLN